MRSAFLLAVLAIFPGCGGGGGSSGGALAVHVSDALAVSIYHAYVTSDDDPSYPGEEYDLSRDPILPGTTRHLSFSAPHGTYRLHTDFASPASYPTYWDYQTSDLFVWDGSQVTVTP